MSLVFDEPALFAVRQGFPVDQFCLGPARNTFDEFLIDVVFPADGTMDIDEDYSFNLMGEQRFHDLIEHRCFEWTVAAEMDNNHVREMSLLVQSLDQGWDIFHFSF